MAREDRFYSYDDGEDEEDSEDNDDDDCHRDDDDDDDDDDDEVATPSQPFLGSSRNALRGEPRLQESRVRVIGFLAK